MIRGGSKREKRIEKRIEKRGEVKRKGEQVK